MAGDERGGCLDALGMLVGVVERMGGVRRMHLRDWALNRQHRGKVEACPPAPTWPFVRSVLSRNSERATFIGPILPHMGSLAHDPGLWAVIVS